MSEVYIVSSRRTATGSFLGSLSNYSATQLGAHVIRSVVRDRSLSPDVIDAVYMGNVLSANLGQSPARQAALGAGIAPHTDCTTIDKVGASGLKAVMLGAQQIQLDQSHLIIAGGMESMSNVPHYTYQRKVNKLGNEKLIDGLLNDGLTDAYYHFHMGSAAELCAREFAISREEQDQYALQSYSRAAKATQQGKFKSEIVPIRIDNSDIPFQEDEDVNKIIPEKVSKLKPAFEINGTITAGNASNLNDGAAAIVLASKVALDRYSLKPLARIISYADAAQAPERFTTSPTPAIQTALAHARLAIHDIDFFEINEAYAAVILANQRLLKLDLNKVNVYGGAIALGHPLGASGARIVCTLLSVLHQEQGRYGVVSICNGGGGASAMVMEKM